MAEYVPVLRTPELGPGEMREVEVHGETLVVVNVGQTYYALSAHCPNDGLNLAREGRLAGELLTCPGDDRVYDVRTGALVRPSGGRGLRRYAIRVEENEVRIGPPLDGG
ncbi:MAG TPA: Rieske 2Fe-2S domain-containing protein [Longimicrobiales bacterium]